jgi:hypothetical protein
MVTLVGWLCLALAGLCVLGMVAGYVLKKYLVAAASPAMVAVEELAAYADVAAAGSALLVLRELFGSRGDTASVKAIGDLWLSASGWPAAVRAAATATPTNGTATS